MQKMIKRSISNSNPPPSPPRLPIIGNLHLLGKFPHLSLLHLSQKYGPLMLLKLGNIETLVVSSADMAKEVYKTHDLNFCNRPHSPGPRKLSYENLDVAFAPYGDHWREMRKLFTFELFNPKRARLSWIAREVEVDHMISSISSQASSQDVVNLDEEMFKVVDGILCRVAIGKSYRGEGFKGQKFRDGLSETMMMISGYSAEDFFPCFGWILDSLMGHSRRLDRCFKDLDEIYEKIIEERLEEHDTKLLGDEHVVDVLVELSKDQSRGFDFTRDHIKAFLMNMFTGGIDTTSVAMVWAMSELIKNPKVMKKVQAEIRSCVGNKTKVEPNDLPNLNYLKMVVKETLRIHPPAPIGAPRETIRECKINGYDIKPRTRVLISAYAIGRDPNIWENPNEFNPERFEESEIDFRGKHFELVPFGGGRRVCPGDTMAIATIEYTLANLLYCFDWELPSGMKREDFSMEEEGGLTFHRKLPLCLVPIKHTTTAQ